MEISAEPAERWPVLLGDSVREPIRSSSDDNSTLYAESKTAIMQDESITIGQLVVHDRPFSLFSISDVLKNLELVLLYEVSNLSVHQGGSNMY